MILYICDGFELYRELSNFLKITKARNGYNETSTGVVVQIYSDLSEVKLLGYGADWNLNAIQKITVGNISDILKKYDIDEVIYIYPSFSSIESLFLLKKYLFKNIKVFYSKIDSLCLENLKKICELKRELSEKKVKSFIIQYIKRQIENELIEELFPGAELTYDALVVLSLIKERSIVDIQQVTIGATLADESEIYFRNVLSLIRLFEKKAIIINEDLSYEIISENKRMGNNEKFLFEKLKLKNKYTDSIIYKSAEKGFSLVKLNKILCYLENKGYINNKLELLEPAAELFLFVDVKEIANSTVDNIAEYLPVFPKNISSKKKKSDEIIGSCPMCGNFVSNSEIYISCKSCGFSIDKFNNVISKITKNNLTIDDSKKLLAPSGLVLDSIYRNKKSKFVAKPIKIKNSVIVQFIKISGEEGL